VDAGIASGDEVSVHYDPMLAKLIVAAPDRPAAVARLQWALEQLAVLGVATNAPLLRALAAEPDFRAGDTSTAYLETHDFTTATRHPDTPPDVLLAAALWEATAIAPASTPANGPYNPWTARGSAATSGAARRFRYARAGRDHSVELTPDLTGDGYRARVDDSPFSSDHAISATPRANGLLVLAIGNRRETCHLARRGYDILVSFRGDAYTLAKPRPLDVESTAHASDVAVGRQALAAPMAGTVIKVNVAEGDTVEAQQILVVLGAMKMEHAVISPYPGRVLRVPHQAGDVVPGGEVLVELDTGSPPQE
jgi:3-methylcrotonyl-CoA carboxylase alpha subunit